MRDYFEAKNVPNTSASWLSQPEIPFSAEILDMEDENYVCDADVGSIGLRENRIHGAWDSKEEYLGTHYRLLREDAVRPLREAVCQVRANPHGGEADYLGKAVGVYDNVRHSGSHSFAILKSFKVTITAVTFAPQGVAIRVSFSLARAGKKVHWEQSNRLVTGSLVALTPAKDMFRTKCVVAIVAARPLAGLEQNPPEIDIFFARAEEIEIDPDVEWVMVEDRSGFYEAERHTLRALQKLVREP